MNDAVATWAPRFFVFGPFAVGPESQLLLRAGVPVRIGTRALDILTALVERPGELVSKRDLFARVWPNTVVEEENLKVNMAALRRVLGDDPGAAKYIATVTGRGYRFIAPVQVSESPGTVSAPTALTPGRELPAQESQIFGRVDTLDAIRLGLAEARLVSIVGAGGIGKTTVAVAAAHALCQDCADGAAFVDLAAINDTRLIPAVIASSLGLGTVGEDPLSSVIHALKSQRKVLLFDNCEHLLPSVAAAVDRLAGQLEGVRIVTTSREPLRIRGERVLRLAGLECDPGENSTAYEARQYPAVALFAARAASRAGYALNDSDAPAVAEICRRLDGNALAIELAANQAARFSPPQIRDMLDDTFQLLKLGPPGAPLRHQTLLATLDWSYRLLSDQEAAVLRAVSVFARNFGVDAALAVSKMDPSEVLDALAQLSAKSLLATIATPGTITYRLLETTRAYATDRLRVSGEERAVRRCHAEYVCGILERASSEWGGRPAQEWGETYASVLDDLHAALEFAEREATGIPLLLRLTVAGTRLWNHLSLSNECLAHVARAVRELHEAGLTGTASEMTLQLSLAGATMFTKGFTPQALAAMRRALDIAEQLGDVDHRLRCLRLIFSFEKFVGEHDNALRTIEEFCSTAAASDPSALPDGETHRGMAELYLGDLESARQRLDRLQQNHMRDVNEPRFARFLYDRNVDIMNVQSYALWLTGSPDAAMRTVEGAVEQALKVRHGLSLSNALATAACPVFFQTGHHREARHYVAMLDEQVIRHGIVIWRPIAHFYRAALDCALNDVPSAGLDGLQSAIAEFRAMNQWARMPFYLAVLAEALARAGRVRDAESTIRVAMDRARTQNEKWCVPEVLRIRAAVFAAGGRFAEAQAILAESMDLSARMGALSWRLRAANDLAKLWCTESRHAEACAMLLPIFDKFTEGSTTHDLVVAAEILQNPIRSAINLAP